MRNDQPIPQSTLLFPLINRVNWPIAMALCCVLLISIAQISMKWGVMQLTSLPLELVFSWQQTSLFELKFTDVITLNKPSFQLTFTPLLFIALGLFCYVLSMTCWIIALKQIPLSLAYPLLSLSYILVYFSAISLPGLNETFSIIKLLGVTCILIGVYLMAPKAVKQTKNDTE